MADDRLALVKFDAKAAPDKLQKDLEKAYGMATKAMKVMGAKLTPKPLAKDLPKVMLKNKKAAEFKLITDKAGKATFAVEIGDYHVPLGVGSVDQGGADLDIMVKKMYALTFDQAFKDGKVLAEMRVHAKKEFNDNNYGFVLAVMAKKKPEVIFDTYVKKGSKEEVNLPGGIYKDVEKSMKDKKPNFDAAVKNTKGMLQADQFPRWQKFKEAQMRAEAKAKK